jgi:hypothetical protein
MNIQEKLDECLKEVLLDLFNKREKYPQFPNLNSKITSLMAKKIYSMDCFKDKEIFIISGDVKNFVEEEMLGYEKPKRHSCIVVKEGKSERVFDFTKYEHNREKMKEWKNDYSFASKTNEELEELVKKLININGETMVYILNYFQPQSIMIV